MESNERTSEHGSERMVMKVGRVHVPVRIGQRPAAGVINEGWAKADVDKGLLLPHPSKRDPYLLTLP